MPQTLSVIRAEVGGLAGRGATHPDVLEAARERLAQAVQARTFTDAQAHACGDGIFLVLAHGHGEDHEEVHRAAWDTLLAAADVARGLHLYGAGQDLLADSFSGNLRGMGPGCAELTLTERPSEPVVVFVADQAGAGAFNLPLYQAFADPFNTPGLIVSDALHAGFAFEVHDLQEHRKIILSTPEEAYDLLAFISSPGRYAVKRVVGRSTGEVAAVSSTARATEIAGRYQGPDGPALIVRAQGAFPAVGEVLEPFATPHLVEGGLRGSHRGPLMPVGLPDSGGTRSDGPPRVVALGYQLAEGRLAGPRDLFADVAFEGARREAGQVTDYLRRHGPFEPHRLPLDEMEHASMPSATSKMAGRWSEI